MSECYVHEKLRRVDSPCPYCALAELRKENERLRAEKLDILRGNFTQVCSYCGFEAQPPNGWDELQKHIVECTEHPLTALRARCEAAEKELADGLTAAHMDGFASGKAEATEMLRKREGQLEELRAEVKAYREVEDSLQKEIKRLDAGVERLRNECDNCIHKVRLSARDWQARAEAAEWKVEKAREAMKSSSSTYSVFDKLRQIPE